MLTDDLTLLREFAATRSEPAFAELVRRHLPLVHAAALRRTGDAGLAEDVAQAVFIVLARKAGTLGPQTILTAWLHLTTRYAAADALKQQHRRQQREHQAYMETTANPPETDAAWRQIAPQLDEAVDALGERDRAAVLLRFFENKTLGDVGAALGVSEDAARVRVNRALDKLHALLAKQGIKFGGALLATAVVENSVQAAPAALVAKVSVLAAKGAATTTSITALVKGTLQTMAWTKSKIATAVVVTGLLVISACLVARYATKVPKQVSVLEISGIIKQSIYYAEAKTLRTITNNFTVKIWDDKARIEAGPMDNLSLSGFEYGMLGKDSYLLIRLVPGLMATEVYQVKNGGAKLVKLKTPVKSENDANLTINDGEVPEYSFGLISPVWMAYCFHLGGTNVNQTTARLPPIFSMGSPFRTANEIADISYTLNSQAPFMLQTLSEYGNPDQIKALAPLTKEIFTNAIYRVVTWTNVGGNEVAQQFQVNNTFIGSRAGVIITRNIVYEGVATNIVVRTEPAPQIQVPKNTRVSEHRSKMVTPLDSFSYLSKDGHLLTREEILKNSEYKDQLSEH